MLTHKYRWLLVLYKRKRVTSDNAPPPQYIGCTKDIGAVVRLFLSIKYARNSENYRFNIWRWLTGELTGEPIC